MLRFLVMNIFGDNSITYKKVTNRINYSNNVLLTAIPIAAPITEPIAFR